MNAPHLPLLLVAGLLGLTACATPPAYDNNFDSVVLAPGESRICAGNPCEVHFKTPPAKTDWEIGGNNVYPARYPAGKTVYLGRYHSGSYSFVLTGSQHRAAYLHVAGRETD